MLINGKYNENEVNDEEDKMTLRATHSKFRRTEGELILKNTYKTLKST